MVAEEQSMPGMAESALEPTGKPAELAALLSARMEVPPDPAVPPLRDDFAPVERYALMLLEAQRR